MKNLFYNSFLVIFLFSFMQNSYSQERTLTGFVTTFENIEVVNAQVKVLSSKVKVFTDTIGKFEVTCLVNDKIKISAKGFNSQKFRINEQTKEARINLKFKAGEKNVDIAVGYGHIKEKDKSYSMSNIRSSDKIKFSNYTNMIDVIVDSSPSIINSGGEIIIRGATSLNGSNAALIIIDGIYVNSSQLSMLPPTDVKSVDILDGGSAAIYGSRGANGVIIITTKRGGSTD